MLKLKNLNLENEGRHEKRFAIRELDLKEIKSILSLHPAMFSEIFHIRKVNNIYFDSHGMRNYHHHCSGFSQRLKIRVRWYGKTFGDIKSPVLELKIKSNELGRKMSFPLKDFKLDKNFSFDLFYKNIIKKSNLPKWLVEELYFFRPTLINFYERNYYLSQDKTCRITLDRNLAFIQINCKNNYFCHKVEDKIKKILELKYLLSDEDAAIRISRDFPFRIEAHSKYILGIDILHLSSPLH